ncbi:MAG: glycosyltransferase family 4 protein [Kiritimatiellia bacterium]
MAQKTRILLLDTNDAMGGVVQAHLLLLRTLDRARFDIYLACLAHGPLLAGFQAVPDVTLWPIEVGTKSVKWCGGWRGRLADACSIVPLVITAARLAYRCRQAGIQVFHTSDKKRSLLLSLLLHRLTRLPYLYHIHNNYIDYAGNRRALARAAAIIANSAAMRQDHIRHVGPAMDRIRVLHNGIDAEQFRPGLASRFRDMIGAAPEDVLIGITSRLAPDKGQETFLRAAALVAREEPRARFVIVGDDSIFSDNRDYISMLKRFVTEQGLSERVVFAGFHADMASVYTGLDVVVNAAWREAFGLVVVEAMACGKVVVGTDAGGIPEIIAHGRDGFLFPPCDADNLAGILLNVVRRPELRQMVGGAARQTVLARFSIQMLARRIEKVYDELTSN